MFFEPSPRNIEPMAAAHLARPVRGKAKVVAVTVDPDDDMIDRLRASLKPDLVQLHGRESPGRAREIAQRAGVGVIKAIGVSEAADLTLADAFADVAEHLMFDWTLLSGRRFSRPWFLAGGLDPWNVANAVRLADAPMVDVSSGVERGPGLKDPALITAFLEAVRRVP
jgi:phosphoribosylanthranilate isomerase